MDYRDISRIIAEARKRTPVRAWLRHEGELAVGPGEDLLVFATGAGTTLLVGEWDRVREVMDREAGRTRYHYVEADRRNSAVPLLALRDVHGRSDARA